MKKENNHTLCFPLCPNLCLFLFPSPSLFFPVLLVFIVITMAAPLESSTFFSTGAINEEGLTPFSSSSSLFSSLLRFPARLLSPLPQPSSLVGVSSLVSSVSRLQARSFQLSPHFDLTFYCFTPLFLLYLILTFLVLFSSGVLLSPFLSSPLPANSHDLPITQTL